MAEALQALLSALVSRDETTGALVDWLRSRSGDAGDFRLSNFDLGQLHRLGARLLQAGDSVGAARLFAWASDYSAQQSDDYGALLFGVHRAHASIDALDFGGAAVILASAFGLDGARTLCAGPDCIRGVIALTASKAEEEDLHELRAEALHALGRLYAAIGRISDGERALSMLLDRLFGAPVRTIETEELALFIGELRIDLGDFGRFAALRTSRNEVNGELSIRWQLLEASVHQLKGEFSTGEDLLRKIVHRPHGEVAPAYARIAAWLRCQCLSSLNRLDEAEQILVELRDLWPIEDLIAARHLLAARRRTNDSDLTRPPTAKEILDADVGDRLLGPAVPTRADGPMRRASLRVRDDWARLANEIQLALHRADVPRALELAVRVFAWTETIDSPLIQARCAYLRALIAHYTKSYADAALHARTAVGQFGKLGMVECEWAALRLLRWTLQRQQAEPAHIATLAEHEQVILRRMKAQLSATDWISYSVHKGLVDEAAALKCSQARHKWGEVEPSGWWHSWRFRRLRQRNIRALIDDIGALKSWEDVAAATPGGDDIPIIHGEDVYTWVREQLRLRGSALPKQRSPGFDPGWLRDDAAILYYVVLSDRCDLWLGLRSGYRLVFTSTAFSRIQMRALVGRAVKMTTDSDRRWDQSPNLIASLRELARYIGLDEAMQELRATSVKRLYIVADDALFNVPFAALPHDGAPLVHKYTLSFLPFLRRAKRAGHVAMKASELGSAMGIAVPQPLGVGDYLEHARAEIEKLRICAPTAELQTLNAGSSLKKAEIVKRLSTLRIAHFACHGDFVASAPHKSGLALYDECLSISDVGKLDLNKLRLVILGSCWSGVLTVLPGRELVGMPTSFLRQGADTVISALWKVSDEASCQIMDRLYSTILACPPAEALALAQVELSRQLLPRQWATFVVFQDGVELGWSSRLIGDTRAAMSALITSLKQIRLTGKGHDSTGVSLR